jgi:hypothetical protein
MQGLALGGEQMLKEPTHPLLVLSGHRLESLPADRRQPQQGRAPVPFDRLPLQQPLALELIGKACHAAPCDHEALRKRLHSQAIRESMQLCEQVKARETEVELLTQLLPKMVLDQIAAGEQTKPKAQRQVRVPGRNDFGIARVPWRVSHRLGRSGVIGLGQFIHPNQFRSK